ncbi:MAG TPA: hypothetical protein VGA11_05220, partial [Acidimicrobiia bacterium]
MSNATTPPSPPVPPIPLDHAQVSAATLACLPDMTPRRLYALLARWGGPPRTLAAVQRGLAVGVLCDQARADDIPRLVALARVW